MIEIQLSKRLSLVLEYKPNGIWLIIPLFSFFQKGVEGPFRSLTLGWLFFAVSLKIT